MNTLLQQGKDVLLPSHACYSELAEKFSCNFVGKIENIRRYVNHHGQLNDNDGGAHDDVGMHRIKALQLKSQIKLCD